MRMLDDVYGDDLDRFPLEQEARRRISRLEWDQAVFDEGDAVWYRVPDEDEDVWYSAVNKRAVSAAARR